MASDLELFKYLVNNQDTPRQKQLLKDLSYEYIGCDQPECVYKLNQYFKVREKQAIRINAMEYWDVEKGNLVWKYS